MRKKRLLIILGLTVAATAFCGGLEYFFYSNHQVHISAPPMAANSTREQVKSPTSNHPLPSPVANKRERVARPSSPHSPVAQNSLPPRNTDSDVVASALRPSSPGRALAGTENDHYDEQIIIPDPPETIATKAQPVSKSEVSLAAEPVPAVTSDSSSSAVKNPEHIATTAPQHNLEVPMAAEPKTVPAVVPADQPRAVAQATLQEEDSIAMPPKPVAQAKKNEPAINGSKISEEDADDTELFIHPKVGYGVRYFELQQSGAFGGIKGSNVAMNVLSLETMVRYGAWNLQVGLEKFSSEFAGSTTDPSVKSEKDFKRFYFKPGYGIFFLGLDGQTAPVVRASGSTLQWADVTTLSVVGGLRFEKLYNTRKRKKPFLLGFEVEGSYPLSASGEGGSPSLSSPSGFGLSLRGYVEKAILRREDYSLYFGLDGSAAYDQMKFNGTWNGSSGDVTRTIQGYGSKVYLKLDF